MWKAAGAGKRAFEMISPDFPYRLHTTKKISPSPTLQIGSVFCIDRLGSFLFCFFYSNLGLPSAKSLQNRRFWFLLSRWKIEPVTTHKMASHLMDMYIIF